MDLLLTILAALGLTLGLLWLIQKLFGVLPGSFNTQATNARVLWAMLTLCCGAFWVGSVDRLLEAEKWTLPFCENLAWIILLPTAFLYCLRQLFSQQPETLGMAGRGESDATEPADNT